MNKCRDNQRDKSSWKNKIKFFYLLAPLIAKFSVQFGEVLCKVEGKWVNRERKEKCVEFECRGIGLEIIF